MKVIAFDPGRTTGFVKMKFYGHNEPVIEQAGEIGFDNLTDKALRKLCECCDFFVMEDAVLTGTLNQDKVRQIQAIERLSFFWSTNGNTGVNWVQPEAKKLVKTKDVPKNINSKHAKDAYKILKAWVLKEEV